MRCMSFVYENFRNISLNVIKAPTPVVLEKTKTHIILHYFMQLSKSDFSANELHYDIFFGQNHTKTASLRLWQSCLKVRKRSSPFVAWLSPHCFLMRHLPILPATNDLQHMYLFKVHMYLSSSRENKALPIFPAGSDLL